MQFYTKNDAGEYNPATDSEIDEFYKKNSDPIVSRRIKEIREKEVSKAIEDAKGEIESARDELMGRLREEAKKDVEAEMQSKFDALTQEKTEIETKLRRKTVAAVYGFKPEVEEFLGSGSEEEMRAKADALKKNFQTANQPTNLPEKGSADNVPESNFVRLNKATN